MLSNIILGVLVMIADMAILLVVVTLMLRYIMRRIESLGHEPSFGSDFMILLVMMIVLFLGQVFMFTTWASLFLWLGEFDDFATAFYHSAVNFTSLGYGDIVMSEERRLLGAFEAANGVMMLGLITGAFLSVMGAIFRRHGDLAKISDRLSTDR